MILQQKQSDFVSLKPATTVNMVVTSEYKWQNKPPTYQSRASSSSRRTFLQDYLIQWIMPHCSTRWQTNISDHINLDHQMLIESGWLTRNITLLRRNCMKEINPVKTCQQWKYCPLRDPLLCAQSCWKNRETSPSATNVVPSVTKTHTSQLWLAITPTDRLAGGQLSNWSPRSGTKEPWEGAMSIWLNTEPGASDDYPRCSRQHPELSGYGWINTECRTVRLHIDSS